MMIYVIYSNGAESFALPHYVTMAPSDRSAGFRAVASIYAESHDNAIERYNATR